MHGQTFKLLVTLYLATKVFSGNHGICDASIFTNEKVQSCPTTENSWVERERKKDCYSIKQNCTRVERFRYHCVVNEWRNATVELCAPVRFVFGYCAEFNTMARRIQYNRQNCEKFSKPCPNLYQSNEVYKYPECFTLKTFIRQPNIDDHQIEVTVQDILREDVSDNEKSRTVQIYSSTLTVVIASIMAYHQDTF